MILAGATSIIFPNQQLTFIVVIAVFNILINVTYIHNLIYENPSTELLYLLTQFYQWTPAITSLFLYLGFDPSNVMLFDFFMLMTYIGIGLFKPKVLVKLLEVKYTETANRVIEKKRNLYHHS
jgi:hypothetical protein